MFIYSTGHSRLRYHMQNKLKVVTTSESTIGSGKMTAQHLFQGCPVYKGQRRCTWLSPAPIQSKMHDDINNLKQTSLRDIQVDVWECSKKKQKQKKKKKTTFIVTNSSSNNELCETCENVEYRFINVEMRGKDKQTVDICCASEALLWKCFLYELSTSRDIRVWRCW